MQNGVNVIAAAPGTVAGFREGVDDVVYSDENAADVDGIECGNGVVISHGAGWVTQYCHLKKRQHRREKRATCCYGRHPWPSWPLWQNSISPRAPFRAP